MKSVLLGTLEHQGNQKLTKEKKTKNPDKPINKIVQKEENHRK